MLTFLFWNMDAAADPDSLDKPRRERIANLRTIAGNLVRRYDVDILMLAEAPGPHDEMLKKLNEGLPPPRINPFRQPDPLSRCEKITIYTRFPKRVFPIKVEEPHYTCRLLRRPDELEILLVVVHLGSKLHRSEPSQAASLGPLANTIRSVEQNRIRHQNTIIVGDFNMNPFENGVVCAEDLNATMSRFIATRPSEPLMTCPIPSFIILCGAILGTPRMKPIRRAVRCTNRPERATIRRRNRGGFSGTCSTRFCFDHRCCRISRTRT